MLKLEEGDAPLIRKLPSGKTLTTEKQLIGVLSTLHLLTQANPRLLCSDLTCLLPYLKGSDDLSKSGEAQVMELVTRVVLCCVPFWENPSPKELALLVVDLEGLVFARESQVMVRAVECKCCFIERSLIGLLFVIDGLKGMCCVVKMGVGEIAVNNVLNKFVSFLTKWKVLESFVGQKPRVVSSIERKWLHCSYILGF